MKARLIAVIAVALSIIGLVVATSVNDPNYGLNLSATAGSGSFHLSWWGEAGKTYYIQHSVNLTDWSYVAQAGIFQGNTEPIEVDVQSNGERGFFKLVITENNSLPGEWLSSYGLDPTTPADVDSDGDGLTNAQEYALGTNPNNADTDGDGFPDGDETTSGSDPNDANSKPPPVTGAVVVQTRWVTILKEDNTPPAASYYFSEEEGSNHPAGWYRDISYNGGDGGSNIRSRWISNEGSGEWEDGPVPSNVPSLSSLNFTSVSESAPLEGTSADSPRISDYGFADYIPPGDGPGSWDRMMPHIVNGTNTQAHTTTTLQTEVRLHREPPDSTSTNVQRPATGKTYVVTHTVNEVLVSSDVETLSIASGCDDGAATLILAPSVEPNTRKKDTANVMAIVADGDQIGKVGDYVPSTKTDNPEKHFVTPKQNDGSEDLNKPDLLLTAQTALSESEFDQYYQWEIPEGKGTVDSTNHLKCRIKRSDAAKIVVKIKKKTGGEVVTLLNVWVVWCDLEASVSGNPLIVDSIGSISGRLGNGYEARAGIRWTATIKPFSIIDGTGPDEERPAFEDQERSTPPGPASQRNGVASDTIADGSGSSFSGWDFTRQIAIRAKKGSGLLLVMPTTSNVDDLPFAKKDYPTNAVESNDDVDAQDEDDDPYEAGLAQRGKLISEDEPGGLFSDSQRAFNNSSGNPYDGDRIQVKYWFREFVRLQIGGQWFKVSGNGTWRFHFFLKRENGEWKADPDNPELFDTTNDDLPTIP